MNLNFAENLKQLRKAKEITQEKLADVLGVTGQTISRWELGICYPDLELLPAIANFFGVSIDQILSNDSSSKERDFEKFGQMIYSFSVNTGERIDFVKGYCKKYPENDYYAYMLVVVIHDYFITTKTEMPEQYKSLMIKNAQRLMETRYRSSVIQMMASDCDDIDLKKWLDMTPYSGFSRRYCLIARAQAHGDGEMAYIQSGIEMFESLARQLDCRCVDTKGPHIKELFHRDVLKTIQSFGIDSEILDGWKMFYAYKQFVLAACCFGQKKIEEGWEIFNAALEKCKYIHSLEDEYLNIGGQLFSNVKVSKDWNYAIDEKGREHKLFAMVNHSFYDMEAIHNLLSNRRWAWFNSVRDSEKYQAAVKWVEEIKKKIEDNEA